MNILTNQAENNNVIFLGIPLATLVMAFMFKETLLSILLISFINVLFSYRFRNFETKNKRFFTPLNLTSYSFFLFYSLQSPIFPIDLITFEIIYFTSKLCSLIIVVFLFFKKYNTLGCNLTLFFHFCDSMAIRLINLDFVKSPTEYYSIFEFTTLLYFLAFLSFYLIRRKPSLEETIRSSILISFCIFALANYWAAGQAKLMLDGGIFSFLQNETFLTASRANFWGLNVIDFSLIGNLQLYEFLQSLGNYVVFVNQVTVPLSIFWPPLIIIYSLFFELFHLLVGMAAGVWFYKWMWITSIIIYLRKDLYTQIRKRTNLRLRVFLFAIIIASPSFMTMEPLAWYEVRQGDVIRAFGNKDEDRFRIHQQYFGSAAFPILAKYSYNAFEYGARFQHHAGDYFSVKLKAMNCDYEKIKNTNFNALNKLRVEEITIRLLEDRPYWSKFLINTQPFHILIPNFEIDHSLLGISYDSITFDNTSVCFNQTGEIINIEKLDEFTVYKSKKDRDIFNPYYVWIGDKIDRMSDKSIIKVYAHQFLEYLNKNF